MYYIQSLNVGVLVLATLRQASETVLYRFLKMTAVNYTTCIWNYSLEKYYFLGLISFILMLK